MCYIWYYNVYEMQLWGWGFSWVTNLWPFSSCTGSFIPPCLMVSCCMHLLCFLCFLAEAEADVKVVAAVETEVMVMCGCCSGVWSPGWWYKTIIYRDRLCYQESCNFRTPGRSEYFSPRLSLQVSTLSPFSTMVVADGSHSAFSSSIVNTSATL